MCVFCKIVKNEIPSYKIYEDKYTLAFLDIAPATYGHVIVIPKKHYKNIFELPNNLAKNLFSTVVVLSKKIKEELNLFDINILNNNGILAGQTIDHFHIHIIPRTNSTEIRFDYQALEVSKNDFSDLQEKLRIEI